MTDKLASSHSTNKNTNIDSSDSRRRRRNSTELVSGGIEFQTNSAHSLALPTHSYTTYAQAGGSAGSVRRRVLIPDTRSSQESTSTASSSSSSASATSHSAQYQYQSRSLFLTPPDQVDDDVPRRVPRKVASSPMLCVPHSGPGPSSVDSASGPRNPSSVHTTSSVGGVSCEPPPYTSLPPPLMPLPAGIPVAIPVPVPVSIAGSDRRSPHVTGRNINDEDVEGEGEEEGIVYTSRNGVIAGTALSATTPGSASGYVHAMNHPPPRNVSPRPQPRLPHSHAHSHSPHIPYPGVNKPKAASSTSLRHRIFAAAGGISYKRNERRRSVGRGEGETEGEGESEWETEGKVICTTPGMVCAGETETETDEPVSVFSPPMLALV